jgi:histidinol-phosphate aminotransferase
VAPLEGRRGYLRLDFNENTLGPSAHVVEAIRALPPEAYATYPEYDQLTARYAAHVGLAPDAVGLFNGSDAAIKAVFDAYGEPGQRFVTTSPTFGYYRPCAEAAGMQVVGVAYQPDFSFPWQALEAELAKPTRLCIICNPNNPTSTLAERAPLLALIKKHRETLFVIDEIYLTYTGVSVLPDVGTLPNAVALHSLSKSCGIAALRIGFACGTPAIVERLARVTGPYDINQFGVVAANAVLDDWLTVQHYATEVNNAKEFTLSKLRELGIRVFSGGGNYFLVWPGRDVNQVEAALRERNILVRSMHGKPMLDGCFRLSVGTHAQMQTFLTAFSEVLRDP